MHTVPRQWNGSSDGLTAAARDRRSIKVPRDWVSHELKCYWQSLSALICVRNGPMLHTAPMWIHVSHYTHKYLVLLQISLSRVDVSERLPLEVGRPWKLDCGIPNIGFRSALLGRSALVALECGSQRMTCRLNLQAPWPKDAFG